MAQPRKQNEALYFMRRNAKLQIGVAIVFLFIILALAGPLLTKYQPRDYVAPGAQPPSSEFWFGTTSFGEDVFTQFVYGLRSTFLVGIVGGGLGTLIGILIGFTAGYRGGIADEVLNMLTNIVLVVPSLVVLLIVAAYLEVRGLVFESVYIALFSWPWAARAIRAPDLLIAFQRFCRSGPPKRYETTQNHLHGDSSEHDVLFAVDVHPSVWRGDPDSGHTGFHRPGPNGGHVTGSHDEQRYHL